MSIEAEKARAALAVMEKHRPPPAGIIEVFGTDYATETRALVAHAVAAGWVEMPDPEPIATPGPTSRARDPFAHLRRTPLPP